MRWQRTDRSTVRDTAAFLATTATRLAINVAQLPVHAARRTSAHGLPTRSTSPPTPRSTQNDAKRSRARCVMLLERLSATERAAYLLREAFDYPYRQVAQVLALTEANARQLVTRARHRLCGERRNPVAANELQELLEAFVAAAQTGDLAALEHHLAGDVVAVAVAA